jgi:hypothetical protein
MKVLKMLFIVAGMVLLAANAWAQDCNDAATPPYDGIYSTLNGTLLPGRSSEAWCTSTDQHAGFPGNTENAMSWDGTMLNSQWHFWGMYIDGNGGVLQTYAVDENGNGFVDYQTNYLGGQFWLWGGHSWSDGTDLTGTVTYLNVGTRISFALGQVVGVTSNILISGVFDDCPNCVIQYSILNAMRVWDPLAGPMPADYPGWECGTTGELYDLCCITTNIVCETVATEESTWGAIKEMHK